MAAERISDTPAVLELCRGHFAKHRPVSKAHLAATDEGDECDQGVGDDFLDGILQGFTMKATKRYSACWTMAGKIAGKRRCQRGRGAGQAAERNHLRISYGRPKARSGFFGVGWENIAVARP